MYWLYQQITNGFIIQHKTIHTSQNLYNYSEQLHTNKFSTMEHQRKGRKSSCIKDKKQSNLKHSTPTRELRQDNVHK